MGFKTLTVLQMAAIACAGVGLIMQIVGVTTSAWIVVESESLPSGSGGLWHVCTENICVPYDIATVIPGRHLN